jgi:hypothetical protein
MNNKELLFGEKYEKYSCVSGVGVYGAGVYDV